MTNRNKFFTLVSVAALNIAAIALGSSEVKASAEYQAMLEAMGVPSIEASERARPRNSGGNITVATDQIRQANLSVLKDAGLLADLEAAKNVDSTVSATDFLIDNAVELPVVGAEHPMNALIRNVNERAGTPEDHANLMQQIHIVTNMMGDDNDIDARDADAASTFVQRVASGDFDGQVAEEVARRVAPVEEVIEEVADEVVEEEAEPVAVVEEVAEPEVAVVVEEVAVVEVPVAVAEPVVVEEVAVVEVPVAVEEEEPEAAVVVEEEAESELVQRRAAELQQAQENERRNLQIEAAERRQAEDNQPLQDEDAGFDHEEEDALFPIQGGVVSDQEDGAGSDQEDGAGSDQEEELLDFNALLLNHGDAGFDQDEDAGSDQDEDAGSDHEEDAL